MKRMVVGFAFTEDWESVILIRKLRPEWMKGKLNGVGGHLRDGERAGKAMEREFEEETGVFIHRLAWERVVVMKGKGWEVTFFRTTLTARDIRYVRSVTDEEVVRVGCKVDGAMGMLPNLSWLIPLCMDHDLVMPIAVSDTTNPDRPGEG